MEKLEYLINITFLYQVISFIFSMIDICGIEPFSYLLSVQFLVPILVPLRVKLVFLRLYPLLFLLLFFLSWPNVS